MSARRTHFVLAALLLALIVVVAGCGSGGGGDDVASASGKSTQKDGASDTRKDQGDAGVKYAQCLRENGLDVEDPTEGKGLQLKIDKSQAETAKKAMDACRKLAPQMNGAQDKGAAANTLKFAQCMRKNGVEDFADPDPGSGQIRIDKKVAEDPDFKKAQEACGDPFGGPPGPGGKP